MIPSQLLYNYICSSSIKDKNTLDKVLVVIWHNGSALVSIRYRGTVLCYQQNAKLQSLFCEHLILL